MKDRISLLLMLALCVLALHLTALAAEGGEVILPATLATVEEETFAGNAGMTSLVIPKTVKAIGSRAFANCVGLREVYFGKNASLKIAADAFEGCGDIHFNAYPDTPGELFALAHGYRCDRLEDGSPFMERALQLVTQNGGTTSILQSADFSTKRLVVRMKDGRLPDISAYKPTKIVMKPEDAIFFVQFGTVQNTVDCYSLLKNREGSDVIFVEPDACVEVIDDMEAVGTVSGKEWDTDDPMGFDVYAPYVSDNSSGKVTIAIIDSGVKKLSAYSGMLRDDGVNLVSDGKSWSEDSMLHGSMIAGIIHDCVGNNNVDILPIRVVSGSNVADCSMIALAIDYAVERGADIINLSLNFDENEYVRYAIGKALNANIRVVVAAGNNSRNIDRVFPANVSGTIVVSGIDSGYVLSGSSNFGENVSYCAPDTGVVCTAYPSLTRKGTSFAAPMVASALALAKLDNTHSEADLKGVCEQLSSGMSGVNNYGNGLIRLERLITNGYTISYDANGGENAPASQEKVPGISVRLTNERPTRNYNVILNDGEGGKTTMLVPAPFIGWNTARSGSGTSYAPSDTYVRDASVKLYAQWDVGKLSELPTATRTEYFFNGWFTSPTGGVQVDADTVISRDVTLYSHWTPRQKYTVSYNANGGEGAPGSQVKLEDVTLKLSATRPTKAWTVTLDDNNGTKSAREIALTFDNWNTETAGTGTKYAAEADYAANAAVTLYAQWISGKVGALPTPTREGYAFKGWTTEVEGGATVTANTDVTGNMTIFAQWSREYTLIFNANGGTVSQASRVAYNGAPIGALPTASRNGYTIAGWYTAASGGSLVTGDSTFNSSTSVTVYAHWTPNSYTVTYDAYGGSVNGTYKTVVYDSTYGSLTTPSRTGYKFLGWYTEANGGTLVESTTKVTNPFNHTIYARWSVNSYTYSIVYRSSNGTSLGSSSATYQFGTTHTISAPEKSGYNTPSSQTVTWDATSKTITFSYTPVYVGYTTTSGMLSSNPSISYYVELQYQNRTASSVEIRAYWKNTIAAYAYNTYQMRFAGSCNGASISDTEVVPFGSWKSSTSYARESSGFSPWVRVGLGTTDQTTVGAHLEMYQYNYYGTNMYNYNGVPRAIVDLNVAIPAY